MFAGKNLRMTQKKASRADLIKNRSDAYQSDAYPLNTKSFYQGLSLRANPPGHTLSKKRLTLPAPCISESCIKININLNFYFHSCFWCLKRF